MRRACQDVIAQAQSGTGKTGAFGVAALQLLDAGLAECQAIVLAPTRELAAQSAGVLGALGMYTGARVHTCIGGRSVREDVAALRRGVHVVVGTPGRVYDMIKRGALRVGALRLFVLDEADEVCRRRRRRSSSSSSSSAQVWCRARRADAGHGVPGPDI